MTVSVARDSTEPCVIFPSVRSTSPGPAHALFRTHPQAVVKVSDDCIEAAASDTLQDPPIRPTAQLDTSSSAPRSATELASPELSASGHAVMDGAERTASRVCDQFCCVASQCCAAVCDPQCVNGQCLESHECSCYETATGPTCATCTDGWTGDSCTTRLSLSPFYL